MATNNSTRHEQRAFASGSRQTPDVDDQFIEKLGYYRKHTATDSTCLFRTVAEQEHGVQMYHESVRRICVAFMRGNKHLFAKFVKGPFTTYLANLALTRTYGSLLELRALAMFYKADVFIYEPLSTGRWFYQNLDGSEKVWRLFVCRANHFDSVYPLEHMQEAAFCQSLVYEVLYKGVFQIPDVEYAVERMLYDPKNITTSYGKDHEGRPIAITGDGRQLVLSRRDNTKCILSNFQLCHFHNNVNFTKVRRFFLEHGNDAGYRLYGQFSGSNYQVRAGRVPNPLLMGRDISCVRQLLNEGVMPFAYKAAKALDAYIYRNVEFDVWKLANMTKTCETIYRNGRKYLYQSNNSLKVCRIENIQFEKGTRMVRMSQTHGLVNVQLASLKPYPFATLHGGHIPGKAMKLEGQAEIEQSSFNDRSERVQVKYYDAVVNRSSQREHAASGGIEKPSLTANYSGNTNWAPWNNNVPMPMPLMLPPPVPYENWASSPVGALGGHFVPTTPDTQMCPPNYDLEGRLTGGSCFAVSQRVSPSGVQLYEVNDSPTDEELHLLQQELMQQSHLAQQRQLQEHVLHHQQEQMQFQLQNQQQQPQSHPHHQHGGQLPFSVFSFQHHSNCPVQNSMYGMLVYVDSSQQHQLSQAAAVGYEPVSCAGPTHYIPGVFHYHPYSGADPVAAGPFAGQSVMMPYNNMDLENAYGYPGNNF
ncbi:protein ovarian tumor locus-like isoform X1 [Anopheles coustani]|uniref:protein ovarian tumor locus-like isoform X1 n=1 Tax=Anopheles coustani TaxID=139045 RepID=UPI00265946E8|nr:protein ovarian tumor locus-like isoform X1 [Anopheles coustani]